MNINKKLLLIILSLLIFANLSALRADEEKINLDEEELPAIDPFQGNSSVSSGQNEQQATDSSNSGGGPLNGMRLVGIIISKNKNIAVLSSPGGSAFKFDENDEISNGTILVEIFDEYIVVEDENSELFHVYMNGVEKKIEG